SSGTLAGTVPATSTILVQSNQVDGGGFVSIGSASSGGNNGTITLTSVDGPYGASITRGSNAGVINVDAGAGGSRSISSDSAAAFVNTGTININTDMSISPTVTQSGGTINIAAGKTLNVTGSFTMTAGTLAVDGVNPG